MPRIKDTQEDYINKQIEKRLSEVLSEKNTALSFEHELPNTKYSPDGIKDKNDRLNFYGFVHERLGVDYGI